MKEMKPTFKFGEHVDIDANYLLLKFECHWILYGQVKVEFNLHPFWDLRGHMGKYEVDFWWACGYWCQLIFVKIWIPMDKVWPIYSRISSTTILCF
jgi:hypothetical protein